MIKNLIDLAKDLVHNRKLLFSLAKNDFKSRYAGSYLGIIWAYVNPVVTILVYWFVFEKGLRSGGVEGIPFVLWLTAGLVPWFFFSDAISTGTNVLLEYQYLVKKVVFKIDILPVVKVMSGLFVHIFFIAIMLLLYTCMGYYPTWYAVQLLYYSLAVTALVVGIVYLTSSVVGFFRDLSQIIGIILSIGVWMTPIMWQMDQVDIPQVFKVILKLNPMYYIVSGYRDAMIYHRWFWERVPQTIYFWCFTLLALLIGVGAFKRLKVHFADVL